MFDVDKFISELNSIKSFNGKIKFADQNLNRIGSGSGRIVYDLGEDKVLKLAKNIKGIAQNEVEAGIGGDYTAKHIVTDVFDSADNNSWVLAEKAKKVTEKRIKELTGIPSLWDLQKFLQNQVDSNRGRNVYKQDQELVDFFWENEFAYDLVTFVVNYGQISGDMGRPSTYGEVIQDGQPAIVLTDYGLNDEVYDTYYRKKSRYNLYELHLAGVNYGDHLADIGNVSQEVRHGMWAFVPAGVGDGDEINEEFVNFVMDRSVYPKQATNRLPQLADIFHSNLNNLGVIIKSVEDPTLFVKNLIALQNYLISHNYYDRQPISINDKPELTKEILDEGVKREVADVIANKIAQKRNYNQLDYIGSGMFGSAYDIGDGKVLKITSDHTEANENMHLKGKPLKHITHPYEVSKINLSDGKEVFFIVLEKLKTDPNTFKKHIDLLDEFFEENIGRGYADIIGDYMYYGWDDSIETVDFRRFMENNPETANFFYSVLAIADELKKYGVGSMDFVSHANLGYKDDGTLAFFDVGFGDYFQPISQDIQSVEVDESFAGGGGTKFTTDDNVSSDGFPTYNNIDTSPSIRNDLDANSSLYNEDLEYNHVDDATKNEFEVGMKKEGVGDEYLKRKYPHQFQDDFEKNYLNYSVKDVTLTALKTPAMVFRGGKSHKYGVYVNPSTLRKFQNNVRGIVLESGNYYICANETVLHQEIAIALKKNGLITIETPQEIYDKPNEIIPVIRRGMSDTIELSASYEGSDLETVKRIFDKASSKSGGGVNFRAVVSKTDKGINENNLVNEKNSNIFAEINENISVLQQLPFVSEIKELGGKIYSVGGAVRDEFLGKESKDLDVLITGIPIDELGQILTKYGTVKLVGESFGVYKFIPEGSSEEIDIAIPRTETPTGGGGHKDFDIKSDHKLPIEKDLYRRDFTINAIAKDINGKIIDPYNGQKDLKNKIIRAVNPDAFSDDPLRMLRAVQFASRFGFTIEPHTLEMIQKNLDSVGNIAFERRFIELEKIQQKGDMRYGAQLLKDTGLFRKLFGYELNQSIIDDAPFNKVKTTGEFIFLLLQESQTPEVLFKTRIHNLNDEYKEIKALNIGYKTNINNIVAARSIAHNMYLTYPKSLESDILPNLIKTACNDLLHGKYPKIVEELAINGNDLMELGLQGKTIGDMKKKLLLAVYADKIINNKEDLINMVKNTKNNIKEEISPETIENAKKNIPIQYTGIVIDDLRKDRLLQLFDKYIPDDWKIINENMHVTIKLGALDDIDPMKYHLNFPIHVNATHIGISDKAIALKVNIETDKIKSKNDIPHITLAYNKNGGAKPKDSNYITDWQELKRPIKIRGIFQEVPYTFNV